MTIWYRSACLLSSTLIACGTTKRKVSTEVVSGSVELDLHEVHQTKVALNSNLKRQELLENRIKRLAFEAERAQKITRFTTLKTEKLLEAREIYH